MSDNDSESSQNDHTSVELGYAEEVENSSILESHYFPSKVGGKPAWLSFKHLPAPDQLKCGVCSQPLCFLLQIYASDYEKPSAFHRSIFLFVCRNGACSETNSSRNFLALRCQLPRINEFYAENAVTTEEEAGRSKRADQFSKLCALCGCLGDKQCAKCKRVAYCDRTHQVMHWKSGHKDQCQAPDALDATQDSKTAEDFLFPEYQLVIETEVLEDLGKNASEKPATEKSEEQKMLEYEAFLRENDLESKNGQVAKENYDDLDGLKASKSDKLFEKFVARLAQNPHQVLRYEKNGDPLWASDFRPGDAGPPPPVCPLCGAERRFEFQLTPHLLSLLKVDDVGRSVDWATVAVYTCARSCDVPQFGYAPEFVWKQDFSE